MAIFLNNIWRIIFMAALLLCSAFFSGSETAFFNISNSQLQAFRSSRNKFQRLAGAILENPRRLLTALLFGNMLVNVSYFALASVFAIRLKEQTGTIAAGASVCITFLILLLSGEMLPKSFAYANSRRFCIAAAPVCIVCIRILSIPVRLLELIIFEPALRLLIGPVTTQVSNENITISQLKLLIEQTKKQGLISSDENQLLSEVLEFGILKVRHVMEPRVDMTACSITDSCDAARKKILSSRHRQIPVYHISIDNIVGMATLRDILLNPDKKLSRILRKPTFVPEQKTVESLLLFFKKTSTDTALVVDEYGGLTGIVSLDKVLEELLGPIEPGSQQTIEQIGPMEYRLGGNLSIHDWAETFGIDTVESRLTTIGGLTMAMLGRIPKTGDTVKFKNIILTVEEVKRNRIQTLRLALEPITKDKTK